MRWHTYFIKPFLTDRRLVVSVKNKESEAKVSGIWCFTGICLTASLIFQLYKRLPVTDIAWQVWHGGWWQQPTQLGHHHHHHHHRLSLTAMVVGAPQMILQPVFSIFPCSPLPSGTWWTPGLSIPWCCLPTSSSVCLIFFPLSLCLARWFWPDLMNGRHDHTTAVYVSLRWSGGLRVVQLPAGS